MIKELKRYLRGNIDLDRSMRPEEIGRQVNELMKIHFLIHWFVKFTIHSLQVDELLRTALDSNFEALSNLNLGHMYVPMEERQRPEEQDDDPEAPRLSRGRGRGLLSRENTDYDTFGSIDSLIFEPKLEKKGNDKGGGSNKEDIKKAHKEIDRQFGYLDVEEAGTDSQEDRRSGRSVGAGKKYRPAAGAGTVPPTGVAVGAADKPKGPGKTTFAERVKLFQNLGRKPSEEEAPQPPPPPPQPLQKNKRIAFLDLVGKHEERQSRQGQFFSRVCRAL